MGDPRDLPRGWLALGLVWVALLFAAVAGLPFFSESYTHLGVGAGMRSGWEAFDPARVPLRPLQYLAFFCLAQFEHPSPGLARIAAFALHAGSAWLVTRLARRTGCGRTGAAVAGALFLMAPNVKNLAWVAAISAPGRVFFLLAALLLLGRPRAESSALRGVLGVLCFLAALAFHQSAVVLLPLLVLLAWTPAGPDEPARPRAVLARPAVLVTFAATVAYVLYFVFLRPERGNNLRATEVLPANLVKGAFALGPEGLRVLVVEGFRGHLGGAGWLIAGTLFAALVAAGAWLLARGGTTGRWLVLAVACDTALPVLTSGYDQRYAYLGTVFVAVACGSWVERARHRALVPVALLALVWSWDLARDTLELRRAGAVVNRVLDQVGEARQRLGPQATIALVDLPDMGGRERDLPIFNWGFTQAAARRGLPGPWALFRTRAFHTSTDSQLVSPEVLAELATRPQMSLLRFDEPRGELVPWDRTPPE